MRARKEPICWACQSPTQNFILVKRNKYSVKKYQCNPPCPLQEMKAFVSKDENRLISRIASEYSLPSPWLDILSAGSKIRHPVQRKKEKTVSSKKLANHQRKKQRQRPARCFDGGEDRKKADEE